MHSFDAEFLEQLRLAAKERGVRIARRMEQVEALKRELWLRMDRLRGHHDPATQTFTGAVWPAADTREAAAPPLDEARRVPAAAR